MAHNCRSITQFLLHEATESITTTPWMGCYRKMVTSLQGGTHLYTQALERDNVE